MNLFLKFDNPQIGSISGVWTVNGARIRIPLESGDVLATVSVTSSVNVVIPAESSTTIMVTVSGIPN